MPFVFRRARPSRRPSGARVSSRWPSPSSAWPARLRHPHRRRRPLPPRAQGRGPGHSHLHGPRRPGHDRRDRPRQRGPVRRRPQEGRVRGPRGRRAAGASSRSRWCTAAACSTSPRRRRRRRRRASSCRRRGRPTDAAGRILLFVVDDLHLDFRNTGRLRELFKKIRTTLLHDGDMWGMVSTGPSSIAIDINYDMKRFDEAMKKITRQRPQAVRDHRGAADVAGAERSPLPGPRRLLDRVRHGRQDGEDQQPPQGGRLREQRLRLQPVPRRARRRRHLGSNQSTTRATRKATCSTWIAEPAVRRRRPGA